MSENIKKWYVLRAIGGKEKKVKEYIDNEVARLKLEEFVSQVLIPTEKVYQIRSGKKISFSSNEGKQNTRGSSSICKLLGRPRFHLLQGIHGY